MRFDSHVADVLRVAADVVNLTTSGFRRGAAREVPQGSALRLALSDALVRQGRSPQVGRADSDVLVRLGHEGRGVFTAAAEGDLESAARRTNDLLGWARPSPRLDRTGEAWDVHFHGPSDDLGVGWAAGCVAGLALALGSNGSGRLGVCDAPRCDDVYVDDSRNGSRRFCSLACQSRVKAAAHRARGR
ncbi:MAG: CGNR zinc finger domain-containing protein [Terracoccus sp.]